MPLSIQAAFKRLKNEFNGDKEAYQKAEPDNFARYEKRLLDNRKRSTKFRERLLESWKPEAYKAGTDYPTRTCFVILKEIYHGSNEDMQIADPDNYKKLEERRAIEAKSKKKRQAWDPTTYAAGTPYALPICMKILKEIYHGSNEDMKKKDPFNFDKILTERAKDAKRREKHQAWDPANYDPKQKYSDKICYKILKEIYLGSNEDMKKADPLNYEKIEKQRADSAKSREKYQAWDPANYDPKQKYCNTICYKILKEIYLGSNEDMKKADPLNYETLFRTRHLQNEAKKANRAKKRKAQEASGPSEAASAPTTLGDYRVSPLSFFFAAPSAPSLHGSLLKKLTEYRLRDDRVSSDTLLENCSDMDLPTIFRMIYNNQEENFLTYAPQAHQRYVELQQALAELPELPELFIAPTP